VTDSRTVVRVRSVGDEYTLRTEATAEHTRAVADHLDRTIRAIMAGSASVEPHRAAILAALQITDELFRERGGAEQLAGEIRRLAAEVRPLLPPAKRGDEADAG